MYLSNWSLVLSLFCSFIDLFTIHSSLETHNYIQISNASISPLTHELIISYAHALCTGKIWSKFLLKVVFELKRFENDKLKNYFCMSITKKCESIDVLLIKLMTFLRSIWFCLILSTFPLSMHSIPFHCHNVVIAFTFFDGCHTIKRTQANLPQNLNTFIIQLDINTVIYQITNNMVNLIEKLASILFLCGFNINFYKRHSVLDNDYF